MRRSWKLEGRLLLVVGVLALVCGTARAGERLDPRVAPTFEAVELRLDADQPTYTGSVRIELQVKEATRTFRFHANGQEFQRLTLKGAGGPIDVHVERGEEGLVTASTEAPLAPGPYTLAIDFSNPFNTRAVGLYRMEKDGKGYLFTQFEAIDARRAFPCWDEPIYKIPYQITLTIPERHVAVSNTPIEAQTAESGWKTLVFGKTRPLPSYLLAIASGPLESVPITGLTVPGRVYSVQGQSHLAGLAVEFTPPILSALERYFGRPYPYEKLDLIAIPEYWPGAMENAGAVTFRDALLLLDPKTASVGQRESLASVTAHELAHMWFGDLVTLSWWDDMWLNESFATWLGGKITDDLFPQYKGELSARREVQGLMTGDARPSTRPIRRPVKSEADIFEDLGLAYGKGAQVLGMVEQWIGPQAFRRAILGYVDAHAWGNARAADLSAALSQASGEDVDAVLSGFLDQAGLPLLKVDVEPGGVVRISQTRFVSQGVTAPAQAWTVPVRLRYSSGGAVETRTVVVDQPSQRLELGKDVDWVVPDAGAYGYYRWTVPRKMLLETARESQHRLTPPERVAFLGNAAALLDNGSLSGPDFLDILGAAANDPEPEVVSSMVSGLGKIEAAFVPDALRGEFAGYVRRTLRPVLDRFGLEKRKGEGETVSLLRPRLISWLGDEGRDAEIRRQARDLAKAYMADSTSVDPALAGVVLRVAAIDGDRSLFDAYRTRFESAEVPAERNRYLGALGAFSDRQLQDAAMRYVLSGPLRPNELFSIPGRIGTTEEGQDRVFNWLTGNYDSVSTRIPPAFAAYMPFLAGGCSLDRLKTARAFFSQPAHRVDGTAANLEKVADQVTDCVSLRQREGPAVEAYLRPTAAKE